MSMGQSIFNIFVSDNTEQKNSQSSRKWSLVLKTVRNIEDPSEGKLVWETLLSMTKVV